MILFCFQETSLLGGFPHFQNLHALFVSSGGSKHLLHHFYHRKLGRWQSNLRSICLNGWLNPQRVVLSFYQGRKMKDGCSVETKITKISWSVLCRVKKMSWTTIFVMMVGPFSKTGSLMTSIVSLEALVETKTSRNPRYYRCRQCWEMINNTLKNWGVWS